MPLTHRLLSRQIVIAGIWLTVAVLNLVLSVAGPHSPYEPVAMVGSSLCGLAVALLLSSATVRLMREELRPHWATLATLAALGGGTVWLVDGALQYWGQHGMALPPRSAYAPIRYNFVYFTLIFALQTAALALLGATDKLARRERQLAAATLAEQRARLAALQQQLNPHFLFNALNALTTLTLEARTAEAGEMIARLADLLRATLSSSDGFATLDEELDAVQAYLQIEAIRFSDRLDVSFDCESGIGAAHVPVFTLQPLVENAIKHAVSPSTGDVAVEIGARRDDASLLLWVWDSGARGVNHASNGFGIGLSNLVARLDALYGAGGQLEAGSHRGGYRAMVRLPFDNRGLG